jgi:hypothetical protein
VEALEYEPDAPAERSPFRVAQPRDVNAVDRDSTLVGNIHRAD